VLRSFAVDDLPVCAISVTLPAAAPMPAEPLALPPLPRTAAADEVSSGQRRVVIVAIAALHGLAGWGALQVPAVRSTLAEAAPMFVDLIAPPTPTPPPPAPPPPKTVPKPIQKKPPPAPLIAAAPSPAPAAFVAPLPPPEPIAAPPEPVAIATPPAVPAPAPPPPPPALIPASALQYLIEPAPEYPRLSQRSGEAGRVIVRVFIDEAGLPRQVLLGTSSGFTRLDGAALSAVQKARFRPPTLNGRPISGWALVPIDFGLEK
jgi:protein TonB